MKNTLTEEQVAERNAEREAERKSKESERMNRLNRKSLERRKDTASSSSSSSSSARPSETTPAPDPTTGLAPAIEKLTTDGTQTTLHFAQ